ncbi:MAG: penicillin-binding transpeptidase domain-containing protein [Bacillota bacterium]|nr:penicillin-binding transpeptidase domain-containing protein [Bacillota bacterium]
MNKDRSKHALIIWFTAVLGAVLVIRLFILTVPQHDKWAEYVDDISIRTFYETAPRGDILDREGRIIATSRPVYSVILSRQETDGEKALNEALEAVKLLKDCGEKTELDAGDIEEKIQSSGYEGYMPITLADEISQETAERIKQENYSAIRLSVNYERYYPNGSLASHVTGYLGRISADEEEELVGEKGYRRDAVVGRSGIEQVYEDSLKGTDAVSRYLVDSGGTVRKSLGASEAVKGTDVRLTLDIDIQQTAEESLKQAVEKAAAGEVFVSSYGNVQMTAAPNAAVGAAVVIDVRTGEVLAMASCPDFDPNDFIGGMTEEKWASLQREDDADPLSPSPLYNVAALTAVQPGSSFKPVTALAALDCGLNRNLYLYDDGCVNLGGSRYGCWLWNENGGRHGYVDLKEALKVSCNYYFYDIACGYDFASGRPLEYNTDISNSKIVSTAASLGLGRKTGIEIEESQGVLPSEALKLQGIKNSLRNYLLTECETYFYKSCLKDRKEFRKKIEKIVDWADKDLTLEEIVGKLKDKSFVKPDQVEALAAVCKHDYFDRVRWDVSDTLNISIGQGDNSYTTLQMANYMAALGRGGISGDATLIYGKSSQERKLSDSSGASSADKDDIEYVIEALTEVTGQQDGSLYGSFGSFPYKVAAKTGTAQRAGFISSGSEAEYLKRHLHLIAPDITFNETEKEADRLMREYPDVYESEDAAMRRAVINLSSNRITADDIDRYKKKYDNFAWTVALAPADDPEIAVAVMLVQGGTSSNAAPVAREIIGKYGDKSGWERLF